MPSKTWTIVCVTLTLLILGCSRSDVASVRPTVEPATSPAVASLPTTTPSNVSDLPKLPGEIAMESPLEIPENFAPPKVDMPNDFPMAFGNSQVLLPVVNGDVDSIELIGFVDAHALKSLLSESEDVKLVRIKDESSDVQVVAVEAPAVTTKQGDTRAELNLFGLPGFHDPKSVVDVEGTRFSGLEVQGLNAMNGPGFPFGGPAGGAEGGLPPLPGMPGVEDVPVDFPGLDASGNPVNPEHTFDLDREATQPGPSIEMPGLEDEHLGELPGVGPDGGLPALPNDPATGELE